MKQFEVSGTKLEIDKSAISDFLDKIVYPIAIVDFETFRTLQKKHFSAQVKKDFFEKIFSVAFVIVNKPEDLDINNINKKRMHLFSKVELPKDKQIDNFTDLLKFQKIFFKFLISKLLKYRVKSLVFLGSRTEVNLLKNYLSYYYDDKKFKDKMNYFFHKNRIFDLYDLWNNDSVVNLPKYKDQRNKTNKIGATKKTLFLIKSNDEYLKFLKPESLISNNDIGRIIDQYFINRVLLLDNFLPYVENHNKNDVLIGAAILSFLYTYCKTK